MEKNKCCCKENHEVNENKLENVTGGSIKSAPVKKYKCPKCGYELSEADLSYLLFI